MKKRIGSKIYDTASAELIASVDNGETEKSPNYMSEALYRKKTNEFFLCVYEGENSPNNMLFGKSDGPKEYIKPITYSEAIQWLNKTQNEDAITLIEKTSAENQKKRIEFFVEADVKKKLDEIVIQKEISLSELIRIALNEYIGNDK